MPAVKKDDEPASMFSQQNNPYCDLLKILSAKILIKC